MKKYLLILLTIALIPGILSAEIFAKTGTAGLQFLKLGVDARAIGMAEAYTAISDDISSVYWNPGGLALKLKNQVMFSHLEYVAGIRYEYFAASKLTSIGTFAISGAALHAGWMDVYTEEYFDEPTGEEFTASDFSVGLTYSNAYTDKFSFGVTAKYLRENLDEYSVNGASIDLGSLYNTGWRNTTVGMSLRNFGPDLKYELDNDDDGEVDEDPFDLLDNDGDGLIDEDDEELSFKLPMNFSLGISTDIIGNRKESNYLIGSFQIDNCVDRTETYNLGFEYAMGAFKIRSGYQFEYDEAGFSAGLGWKVPVNFAVVKIDYSYSYFNNLAENAFNTPQRVSIKLMY